MRSGSANIIASKLVLSKLSLDYSILNVLLDFVANRKGTDTQCLKMRYIHSLYEPKSDCNDREKRPLSVLNNSLGLIVPFPVRKTSNLQIRSG